MSLWYFLIFLYLRQIYTLLWRHLYDGCLIIPDRPVRQPIPLGVGAYGLSFLIQVAISWLLLCWVIWDCVLVVSDLVFRRPRVPCVSALGRQRPGVGELGGSVWSCGCHPNTSQRLVTNSHMDFHCPISSSHFCLSPFLLLEQTTRALIPFLRPPSCDLISSSRFISQTVILGLGFQCKHSIHCAFPGAVGSGLPRGCWLQVEAKFRLDPPPLHWWGNQSIPASTKWGTEALSPLSPALWPPASVEGVGRKICKSGLLWSLGAFLSTAPRIQKE